MFEGRMPARFADRAPRGRAHRYPRRRRVDLRPPDESRTSASTWSWAGRRPSTGWNPTAFDEMRRGCYDVDERVKDMSAGGVLVSHVLPVVPLRSPGRLFLNCPRTSSSRSLCVQAYNDWHIDEWCGSYPGRFIPMALPVLWDPEASAAEVRRVAKKGCHSLTFTENPATLGLPELPRSVHWDPSVAALVKGGGRSPQRPPRFVRSAHGHRSRCADRRHDHAPTDQHLPGRGRSPCGHACSRSSRPSTSR